MIKRKTATKNVNQLNGWVILLVVLFIYFLTNSTVAQKQTAITIDDPNTQETPAMSWLVRDSLLLNTLDLHRIKAALFVCGGLTPY